MKFLSDDPNDGEYMHMKAGIVIAYFGGLRCADLVALNCKDLEFNETLECGSLTPFPSSEENP